MTETSKAWVWTQYRGVISDNDSAATSPLPLFGDASALPPSRTRRGGFLAITMLIGLLFPKIAFLLLVLSGLLILRH